MKRHHTGIVILVIALLVYLYEKYESANKSGAAAGTGYLTPQVRKAIGLPPNPYVDTANGRPVSCNNSSVAKIATGPSQYQYDNVSARVTIPYTYRSVTA